MVDYLALKILFIMLVVFLVIWDMTWKAIGMWKAGRNNQLVWFVFIFILNTAGILPIVYIFFFQRNMNKKIKTKIKTKK
ncbi:MAG: DUF5652 family protein [Candidatus Woesearchaeota archaeon]|jgi:hypothetical protein|nr:DUF5652 family protein [Candidatus Woesearchaeota archaeon]